MSENVIELDDTNFENTIKTKNIAVVDFWAVWCGPCQMFAGIFENFAKNNEEVFCEKVNVDNASKTAEKYKIMSIPSVLFFKDGVLVKQEVGVLPEDIIKKIISEIK